MDSLNSVVSCMEKAHQWYNTFECSPHTGLWLDTSFLPQSKDFDILLIDEFLHVSVCCFDVSHCCCSMSG